jgi:anti-anti-sigma regulatory factor
MVASQSTILPAAAFLSHAEAARLASLATRLSENPVVLLDLSRCERASTAAFARLVLLRRALMANGRDLRLAGLHDQPARLFEVHRLDGVLPTLPVTKFADIARRGPSAAPLAATV